MCIVQYHLCSNSIYESRSPWIDRARTSVDNNDRNTLRSKYTESGKEKEEKKLLADIQYIYIYI